MYVCMYTYIGTWFGTCSSILISEVSSITTFFQRWVLQLPTFNFMCYGHSTGGCWHGTDWEKLWLAESGLMWGKLVLRLRSQALSKQLTESYVEPVGKTV